MMNCLSASIYTSRDKYDAVSLNYCVFVLQDIDIVVTMDPKHDKKKSEQGRGDVFNTPESSNDDYDFKTYF